MEIYRKNERIVKILISFLICTCRTYPIFISCAIIASKKLPFHKADEFLLIFAFLLIIYPFFTKNALMPSISKICPDMVYLGVKKNFFIGGKEVVFNDGFKNTHFTEFIID